MHNQKHWLAALVALCLSAQSVAAKCTVGLLAELPVTMHGMEPMIPAKINGANVLFMVDSGAFFSSISTANAAQYKLSLSPAPFNFSIIGVGGETHPAVATVKMFTLANAPLYNIEFLVTPGGDTNGSVGVLGQNVLGIGDVEYDLPNGAVRLFRPEGCGGAVFAYWAGARPYSVVDINYNPQGDHRSVGDVLVNGVRLHAIFDTGAANSVISLRAAARAGIKPDGPGVTPIGFSHGFGRRLVRAWIAPLASFKISDEEIRNTKISIADFDLNRGDMLLGADFFLSHRVYVANRQNKIYFTYEGGPVFNLASKAMKQEGADKPLEAAPVLAQIDHAPTDAEGFSRRGAAFASRRDFDHAIEDFNRACELAPTEAKYFYQRAMARLGAKQPFLAMADLDQALKLKPDDIGALTARASLRLTGHDKAEALSDLDAIDHAAAKEAQARLQLGAMYEGAGRPDLAVAQYSIWLKAHPDDALEAQALNGRCWARALTGQGLDLAERDCNSAIGRAPKNAAMYDSRGLVRLRRGNLDGAIADYNLALAMQPKLAWSLYGRGLAKTRKGQIAEGTADIAAAAAQNPDLPEKAKTYGVTLEALAQRSPAGQSLPMAAAPTPPPHNP